MKITNLKLLPLVTALCVLVLTAVGCRHNVVLQELLRNRNKRTVQDTTFPEAYYVKAGGKGDGTAYSTPFGTLKQAMDAARNSGGKVDRVIVIGPLKKDDSGLSTHDVGGGGISNCTFFFENYGTIENPITIGGMTGATLLLDATKGHVVGIGNNNYLHFENITIKDGKTPDAGGSTPPLHAVSGGGLCINGTNSEIKLLNGARITGNSAYDCGGGIYTENGRLTIDGAEISNNGTVRGSSSAGGCGLYAGGSAEVTINSGLFTANRGGSLACSGGGIYIANTASFIMNGGSISANSGVVKGGGIYFNSTGKMEINGGIIHSNSADNEHSKSAGDKELTGGGGIYINSGTVQMRGAAIYRNNANAYYVDGATYYLNSNGGGIYVNGGTLIYDDSVTVYGNTAPHAGDTGKSIYAASAATVTGTPGTPWSHTAGSAAEGYDEDIIPAP